MLVKTVYFFSFILCMFSCKETKQNIEDPFEIAKSYCSCIDEELKQSSDSSINIYDCEKKVFPKSRIMSIYMAFNDYNMYGDLTLDSARKFAIEVGNIIDSMCINKIDPKRIKKVPHIRM
jgi:hypothetical protein